MGKSLGKTGMLALATILVVILALPAFGCSATGEAARTGSPPVGAAGAGSADSTTSTELKLKAEEWAAKIPDLQEAVEADPTDLAALQDLAVAQYQAKLYDDAGATYLKMLAIEDDPLIHNNYGNVLRDAGKIAQAKVEYETAIAADPTMTTAYLNLAGVYERQRNVTEAINVLDQGMASVSVEDQQRLQTYKDKLIASTIST